MPTSAEVLTENTARLAASPKQAQVLVFDSGFMFSCEGIESVRTERFTATVLLANSDLDFEVDIDGHRQRLGGVLLKPFLPRSLHARGVPLVSVGVNPSHPAYRALAHVPQPGYAVLSHRLFAHLREPLQALRRGQLGLADSHCLFDQCISAVAALLPPLAPIDPRVNQMMTLLGKDHTIPLEALAEATCLSYFRLSHLFSQEMGMSLRQYLLSLKIRAACRCIGEGMSLTAAAHSAGFTDSAHLSRVWTKAFGGPPSYFLNSAAFCVQPAGSIMRRNRVAA